MPEALLTRRALNRATLARQMLLQREKVKTVAAIERLAGMQAQLARPPFVGLWSRVEGFKREDLIKVVERREVVRGTLMRATIHLVSRKDFLLFRPALQPMLSSAMKSILRDRTSGIDLEKLLAEARAFFDRQPCTFAKLREHLGRQFPALDERAMGYIVRTHLPLVQTPKSGEPWAYSGLADFAVADTWLGEPVNGTPRPLEIVLHYLAAFGPASVQDFQAWSGMGAVRALFDELRPRLKVFRDERGRELFDLPKAPRPDEDVAAPVRFLPEYDNLTLGHADRTRIIAEEHRPALLSRNLYVPGVLLVDGFAAGLWKVETKKRTARLMISPFEGLPKAARKAVQEEGEQLLRFVEPEAKEVVVELGKG